MVSLTFGQIVAPPTRRYNAEDEDGPEARQYELVLSSPQARILVVAVGRLAPAFTATHFLTRDATPVGQIVETRPTGAAQDVCHIFSAAEGVLICHVLDADPDFNLVGDMAAQIVRLVRDAQSHIVVLTSDFLTSFKSLDVETDQATSMTRTLCSRSWLEPMTQCPPLEAPNMITGIPAAVLTLAQFRHQPCLVLANFVDSPRIDSVVLAGFQGVFQLKVFKDLIDQAIPRPDAAARVAQWSRKDHGNLYM
eukprot:maker-scaffold561_size136864-snap-gene-0.24 protein:Tk09523 transcript:maker-scaffold561_size136864-snap-gene-0.24-mRNA-1 annotation:"proteasome assembly chaperone 1"